MRVHLCRKSPYLNDFSIFHKGTARVSLADFADCSGCWHRRRSNITHIIVIHRGRTVSA